MPGPGLVLKFDLPSDQTPTFHLFINGSAWTSFASLPPRQSLHSTMSLEIKILYASLVVTGIVRPNPGLELMSISRFALRPSYHVRV